MVARIFKSQKSAMQSGMGQAKEWILELEYDKSKSIDPLMGWTGSSDTSSQIQIKFPTRDAAILYAKNKGLTFTILKSNSRKHIIRENGYGENFSYNKKIPWTH